MTPTICRSRRDPRSAAFGTGPGTPPPAWLTPGHRIAVRGRTQTPGRRASVTPGGREGEAAAGFTT